jgi:hypothetical protein
MSAQGLRVPDGDRKISDFSHFLLRLVKSLAMRTATFLALLAASAVVGAAAQQAPLLPPDGASGCNRGTFYEATSKEKSCGKTMFKRDDPGKEGGGKLYKQHLSLQVAAGGQ